MEQIERKRIHVASNSSGVNIQDLIATVDEANGVNFHNVHCGFACEPENAGANSNGTWVLWCLPDAVSAVPSSLTSVLEAEGSNPYIWAMGVWIASNETPYSSGDITFRTTRNCQNGGRLVLSVNKEGISAGNVRVVRYLTYNTKSL